LSAFHEGLTAILPFVERRAQAFGDLARNLGRDYIAACEKAATEPDTALLERVARALGAVSSRGAAHFSPPFRAPLREAENSFRKPPPTV
jgi:hypothetical protein